MTTSGRRPAWLQGRVYRCAWCSRAGAVTGGLPYYTYVEAPGGLMAVPATAAAYAGTDGICPAHAEQLRERLRGIA